MIANRRLPEALPSLADALTHVELTWLEKRIEHWITLRPTMSPRQILDRRRRILSFAPGSIFAFVRWACERFRHRRLAHRHRARGRAAAKPIRRCPSCVPAARSCCASLAGPRSSACCRRSTPSRQLGVDPADAAPDHWRHVHNRLAAGDEPRPYTPRAASRLASAPEGRVMTRFGYVMATYLAALAVGLSALVPSCAQADLERQRQRADRSLRRASGRRAACRELSSSRRRSRSRAFSTSAATCRRACRC